MSDVRNYINFDAMAVVYKTDIKKSGIKNCWEFAINFMDTIDKQVSGFQEVRIILTVMTLIHWNVTRKYRIKQLMFSITS